MEKTAYLYALGANLSFAVGTLVYTRFTRRISSTWVNAFKAALALAAFAVTVTLTSGWQGLPFVHAGMLFVSGLIGLGIGDLSLLKALGLMGPGRTLMLFAFQPLVIGVLSYIVFGQTMDVRKSAAILFFIGCLGTISFESYKKEGRWNLGAIGFALLGMLLDAVGIIFTRYVFENNPALTAMEGNVYRCVGAVVLFWAIAKVRPYAFWERFRGLSGREKVWVTLGSLLGCYFALLLYLNALKYGHLASISGIAITGTIFASALECIVERRKPSLYLLTAFAFFLTGMSILFG